MPGGRPSDYKPEYCDMLVEHMSKGFSFESFGATIQDGPTRSTLYLWADTHPEFSDAKRRGFDKRLAWMEHQSNLHITGESKGNAVALMHRMKCVEPELYLEKTVQEVKNTHSLEDVDTSKLTNEELAKLNELITKCAK